MQFFYLFMRASSLTGMVELLSYNKWRANAKRYECNIVYLARVPNEFVVWISSNDFLCILINETICHFIKSAHLLLRYTAKDFFSQFQLMAVVFWLFFPRKISVFSSLAKKTFRPNIYSRVRSGKKTRFWR